MSVIILIIILGVLIFVHELGHFLIAKKSGIRVDEFAIGFPPRIWSTVKNGTKYSLNWIPFGGYVKIFGEEADDESLNPNNTNSFLNKSRLTQAAVLIGGVLFNVLFAWILISITLMAGSPAIVTESNRGDIKESFIMVTGVFENSPAAKAGIEPGDQILKVQKGETILNLDDITVESIQKIISAASAVESSSVDGSINNSVTLTLRRSGEEREVSVTAEKGIIGEQPAIGVSMDRVGKLQLPFFRAIGQGFLLTGQTLKDIAIGLAHLINLAIHGQGSLNDIAGPVGIVELIGDAANFGFYYLVSFTAFISLNLALLNILPLPALDGGRLVVVLIESVTRRRIKPSIVNVVNSVGFALLILLMIVITVNDILRLV